MMKFDVSVINVWTNHYYDINWELLCETYTIWFFHLITGH